jgi:hypothetical protein
LSEKSNSQIQKVKALCAKLTENVKDHLQNNEVARTHLETTVNASIVKMEGKLEVIPLIQNYLNLIAVSRGRRKKC